MIEKWRKYLPKRERYLEPDYYSLSVKDLLEAREAFHIFLSSLKDVVGTGIGRYRYRKNDLKKNYEDIFKKPQKKGKLKSEPRTLEESVVTSWSWPCILVFVNKWRTEEELRKESNQIVPRLLYMGDGRVVPTCVIEAPKREEAVSPLKGIEFPHDLGGGGYPILKEVQGSEHRASLGCLVTDGERIYGLTNRHVIGEGTEAKEGDIYTYINGEPFTIGYSTMKSIGKKTLEETYKGWPGKFSLCNIDAGLIELKDLENWTAQLYGIGELGKPVDLHAGNITLNLIGCPVLAFGGASGRMEGEIVALFYRYKSIGGIDYVSDLLIGPRNKGGLMTHPGDSGTLWVLDLGRSEKGDEEAVENRNRPVALQWGGQVFLDKGGSQKYGFALATFLSTVCRELDVEVVRDWNMGYNEYWGKVGHFKIAAKACELISNQRLKDLMQRNLENISFDDQSIIEGMERIKFVAGQTYVQLADVPDYVWKLWYKTKRGAEGPNHYVDMDEEGYDEYEGETLLKLTESDNVSIQVWNRFYDSIDKKQGKKMKRGALPFRIEQIYREMVDFLKVEKDIEKFVCAAGIVAHYVGDACMPLHLTKLNQGHPDKSDEKNVHTAFDDRMINQCAAAIFASVNEYLQDNTKKYSMEGGEVASLSVKLMRETFERLPPETVIKAYNETEHAAKKMFNYDVNGDTLGNLTANCMAEGCLFLASLWESAWVEGKGDEIPEGNLIKVERDKLQGLYSDKEFLESFTLNNPKFAESLGKG